MYFPGKETKQVCINEQKSGVGELPIMKYYRPPWLADEVMSLY